MPKVKRTYWLYPLLDTSARLRSEDRERNGGNDRMYKVDSILQANLVSSNVLGKEKVHAPVIDFDIPVRLVQSSTKGHGHLYIDKEVDEDKYYKLLDALVECGLVEEGFVRASKRKGGTFVRPPGVYKRKVKVREPEQVSSAAATD